LALSIRNRSQAGTNCSRKGRGIAAPERNTTMVEKTTKFFLSSRDQDLL
jgi:hypothetical protein